jgi:hypothetical protein
MGDSGAGLGQHRGTQVGQVLALLTGLHPGPPKFPRAEAGRELGASTAPEVTQQRPAKI